MPVKRTFRAKKASVKRHSRGRSLGIATADPIEVVRMVRKGFLFSWVKRLQKSTGLSVEAIASASQIPKRTLTRRMSEGRLRPDESDRILRIARIFEMALDLFEGDVESTRKWLGTPQRGLGGELPLEFASSDVGAREVEKLIARLEHGVFT